MSPAEAAPRARPATGAPSTERTRPWAWVVLGLIVVLVVAGSVRQRVEQQRQRRPLEVVGHASVRAHKPIGLLAPGLAERWSTDSGGPSEERVRALVREGNAYVEPLFYDYFGRHGDPGSSRPPSGSRCYYFPVQRGRTFDASRVTAVQRFCYLDGTVGPSEWAMAAVQ